MKKQKEQAKMTRRPFLIIYQSRMVKKRLSYLTAEGTKVSQRFSEKNFAFPSEWLAGRALRYPQRSLRFVFYSDFQPLSGLGSVFAVARPRVSPEVIHVQPLSGLGINIDTNYLKIHMLNSRY